MRQFMLIIDGPMGSGKSTVAKILHPKLSRTAWVGLDRTKWFVSGVKRTVKDNAMGEDAALAMAETYVRNGINLLFAQQFVRVRGIPIDPEIALAKKYEMRLFIYRLTAPHAVLLKRCLARPQAALARTPLTKARILMNLREFAKQPKLPVPTFDSSKLSPEEIATMIRKDVLG